MEIGKKTIHRGMEGVQEELTKHKECYFRKKQKEFASVLNDPNHQNEIFRIAKQMVKE